MPSQAVKDAVLKNPVTTIGGLVSLIIVIGTEYPDVIGHFAGFLEGPHAGMKLAMVVLAAVLLFTQDGLRNGKNQSATGDAELRAELDLVRAALDEMKSKQAAQSKIIDVITKRPE